MPLLPRPPRSNSTIDFVVIVFVVTVASILILGTVFLAVSELVDPEQDHSAVVNSLTDTLNTIIGALIGFVAGKGHGRLEEQEKQDEPKDRTPNDTDNP